MITSQKKTKNSKTLLRQKSSMYKTLEKKLFSHFLQRTNEKKFTHMSQNMEEASIHTVSENDLNDAYTYVEKTKK